VDHGTAYDIAGKGLANSRSLEEAIRLAAEIVSKKRELGNG
jgi:4-hydroxy-L-threonine phosphate dehydrogenase PdxA